MSMMNKITVECAYCHAKGEYTHWSSINVDLNPELRKDIFSGKLFEFHCPECGKITYIPAGTLYHDMKRKFMLFFDFRKPQDFDYAPMEMPEDFPYLPDYKTRGVFGLYQFKEKIRIFEHGLDDVAIERMKYMITRLLMPEIAARGYTLYFSDTHEATEEDPYGLISFFYYDPEQDKVMPVVYRMEAYYNYKLACEIDPRMAISGWAPCVDEEWISQKLKEDK